MDGNSFGRLFTAISCSCNSGLRLRASDTKSRLETSKDRHFRLPEVQGKLQLLLEIIYYTRRSRIFWYEFTYPNSSQITMLIKLAKQSLPTWTIKDKPYVWNFPLYSSSSVHTFIMAVPFEHRKMPVERKHKFRRNTLSKHLSQFHCSELNRIRNKIRAKAYTNSSQSSSDTRPNDKANDTKERLIY